MNLASVISIASLLLTKAPTVISALDKFLTLLASNDQLKALLPAAVVSALDKIQVAVHIASQFTADELPHLQEAVGLLASPEMAQAVSA